MPWNGGVWYERSKCAFLVGMNSLIDFNTSGSDYLQSITWIQIPKHTTLCDKWYSWYLHMIFFFKCNIYSFIFCFLPCIDSGLAVLHRASGRNCAEDHHHTCSPSAGQYWSNHGVLATFNVTADQWVYFVKVSIFCAKNLLGNKNQIFSIYQ